MKQSVMICARLTVSVLVVLGLVQSSGCKERTPGAKRAARAAKKATNLKPSSAPARPGALLERGFSFRCSVLKKVGCRGIFPVRQGSSQPGAQGKDTDPLQKPPSRAAILWSGEDAFRARMDSLKRARRSIRIQALIFRGDEAGLAIASLLKQKKRQGLQVQVIVDAISNLDWQTQWMYFDLKRSGIEVEGYEALYLQWLTAEVKLTDPLRPNKRFHDKMWVVDGESPEGGLAIVGGLNIANEYFRVDPAPANRWHDQDILLQGPIVRDVTRAFDRNYAFFKGIKGKRPALFNPDNSWKLARKILAKIKGIRYPSWKRPHIERSIAATLKKKPRLDFSAITARFLQSRPRFKETFISQAYLNLIRRAKESILIANAYFIPSREMINALKQAARRGVRVKVLTNSPETNDIAAIAVISRYVYQDLLEVNSEPGMGAGSGSIAIHEWSGAPFKEGTLHAKYAVFDSREAIIGSFNLDPRSARLNSETAIALQQASLVGELARRFSEHDLPRSKKITLEQARSFHKPGNIKKRFKLLFTLPIKEWL